MKPLAPFYLSLCVTLALITSAPRVAAEEVDLLAHFEEVSGAWAAPTTDLAVLELDVTGDGLPEIFMGAIALAGGGQLSTEVYSPVGESQGYKHLGQFVFSPRSFRFEAESGRAVVIVPESLDYVYLAYYSFDESGIRYLGREPSVAFGSEESDHQLELNRAWRDNRKVDLLMAPLAAVKQSLGKASGDGSLRWKAMLGEDSRALGDVFLRGRKVQVDSP